MTPFDTWLLPILQPPIAILAWIPCDWQSSVRLLWILLWVALLIWLIPWLAQRLVPAGPQRPLRQRQVAAAINSGALAAFGMFLGWFEPTSLDLPAPTILARQWRWLALVPLAWWLTGLTGLSQPARSQSLAWSKYWSRIAAVGLTILLFSVSLTLLPLGCVI